MPKRKWVGLDGLRGIAVIVVVLFHVGLAPGGFMGVDVFFVLSGFLITRLLLNEFERTGTIRLPRFTVRRLMRLYPALLVVCLFVLAVSLVARRSVAGVVHDVIASLTYTSNFVTMQTGLLDHTWTLSLEEQFYLVWPGLLLLALVKRAWWAWLPIAAVVLTMLTTDLLVGQSGALHTYVRAMGLPLGCAVAFASPRMLAMLARLAPLTALGFIGAVFVPLPSWLTTGWPISVGALLAAPLVAALVVGRFALLEWHVIRWFGLRSYSLYLWHLPLISLALFGAPQMIPTWIRLLGAVGASLVAAELSYRFVEQPILRLRDRLRPPPMRDPGPDPADTPLLPPSHT